MSNSTLSRCLLKNKGRLVVALCGSIIVEASQLAYPWARALFIDDVMVGKNISVLPRIATIYITISLLMFSANILSTYLLKQMGEEAGLLVRKNIVKTVIANKKADVEQARGFLSRETEAYTQIVTVFLPQIVGRLTGIILPFIILLRLQPKLALMTICAIPFVVLATKLLGSRARLISRLVLEESKELAGFVVETVQGITDIQIYELFDPFKVRLDKITQRLNMRRIWSAVFTRISWEGAWFLASLPLIWVYYHQGLLGAAGSVTPGTVLMLADYVTAVLIPLLSLASLLTHKSMLQESIDRVEAFIEGDPTEESRIEFSGIELDDIGYAVNGQIILSNVSLTIEKKQLIVITGENGSGKSTLMRIIAGLINPTTGKIVNNGGAQAVNNDYLPQRVHLFNDTIANNILLGSSLDSRRFNRVLKASQCASFVDKTHCKDTLIHNEAVSGGQRKRLGVARFLYRDQTSLWLLDEPVAELDDETASRILQFLASYRNRKTIIMVLHNREHIKIVNPNLLVKIDKKVQVLAYDEAT